MLHQQRDFSSFSSFLYNLKRMAKARPGRGTSFCGKESEAHAGRGIMKITFCVTCTFSYNFYVPRCFMDLFFIIRVVVVFSVCAKKENSSKVRSKMFGEGATELGQVQRFSCNRASLRYCNLLAVFAHIQYRPRSRTFSRYRG